MYQYNEADNTPKVHVPPRGAGGYGDENLRPGGEYRTHYLALVNF